MGFPVQSPVAVHRGSSQEVSHHFDISHALCAFQQWPSVAAHGLLSRMRRLTVILITALVVGVVAEGSDDVPETHFVKVLTSENFDDVLMSSGLPVLVEL